jgi:hypothetical protein
MRQVCGVWDHQSGPLDWETSKNMARVFAVILVAKKSQQKGLSQGLLDGCKLRADNRIVLISTTVESLYSYW